MNDPSEIAMTQELEMPAKVEGLDAALQNEAVDDFLETGIATLQTMPGDVALMFQQPETYAQLGLIAVAALVSIPLALLFKRLLAAAWSQRFAPVKTLAAGLALIASSLVLYLVLSISVDLSSSLLGQAWLVKIAQGLALAWLLLTSIRRFIEQGFVRALLLWTLVPMAVLYAFNILPAVQAVLAGWSVSVGNITLSLLGVIRATIFGAFFYWLGNRSNVVGQKAIREQANLDVGTRELLAKLFEIVLFSVLFILLLQIAGINLTALTVFGGALGVGLGFGLQQIASNFISGMIILFDRSITVGDHIELDDGTFGILREIKLRYAVIETYEGKEVMVPNETFVTSAFTNWSHTDDKQRYDFTFSVSYDTDLNKLFPIVRDVVASHPQVISGDDVPVEELPDAEIDEFGDSGIVVLVEFWMHGIDDGRNRVDADLKLMIWQALKDHGFSMPFPQREVRLLNSGPDA